MDETALSALHEGVSSVGNGGLVAFLCNCLYANADVDDELQRIAFKLERKETILLELPCNTNLFIVLALNHSLLGREPTNSGKSSQRWTPLILNFSSSYTIV